MSFVRTSLRLNKDTNSLSVQIDGRNHRRVSVTSQTKVKTLTFSWDTVTSFWFSSEPESTKETTLKKFVTVDVSTLVNLATTIQLSSPVKRRHKNKSSLVDLLVYWTSYPIRPSFPFWWPDLPSFVFFSSLNPNLTKLKLTDG